MFLRVAVIGIGRMGSVHAGNLIRGRVKNAVLAAVCDIKEEKLRSFIAQYGKIPAYTDYKVMLNEQKPDAVIIATEHTFHVSIASYCIKAGVHTLIEKPVAVTAAEAGELNALLEQSSGVICAVMYNQRTNAMYRKAKSLIESGILGKIQRLDFIITNWYRSQSYYDEGEWRGRWSGEGGGTLINQCVHQLDILQWIAGLPEKVYADISTINRKITAENDVTAVFTYPGGYKCVFTASAHELYGTNRFEIACEKGHIVISGNKMKYSVFKQSEKEVNENTESGYGRTKRKKFIKRYGILRLLRDLVFGQQLNIIKNFCNAVAGKEELISPAAEGINAVRLINAVYMSAWEGKEIAFPADEKLYAEALKAIAERETEERA